MLRELMEMEREHERLSSVPPVAHGDQRTDWFTTSTGKRCWIGNPVASEICLEDIARSLARQCRFAGHLRDEFDHYSVAQHSVLVSRLCKPEHALIGLLHDATEAYLQDIIRPLKKTLGAAYRDLEARWALALGDRFGLEPAALLDLPDDVEHADVVALMTERRDLLDQRNAHLWTQRAEPHEMAIWPFSSRTAYRLFMNRFREITAGTALDGIDPELPL